MIEAMLNRIGQVHERAAVKTVFGEPYEINGRTIIPIARVLYGFGFGAGRSDGHAPDDEDPLSSGRRGRRAAKPGGSDDGAGASGTGGGGGAGISVRPVAVLEIKGAETKIRPIVDVTRLAIAGMLLAAWNVFWISYTVRRTAARRTAERP